jgi:endonuclease/exonuclease/phosphatase family metal-dependent hydrolase
LFIRHNAAQIASIAEYNHGVFHSTQKDLLAAPSSEYKDVNTSIKLITLNLRHDADRWQGRFKLVLDCLVHQSPDIIALQEVALTIDQAHQLAARLNQLSQGQTYQVIVAKKWEHPPTEGIAILSRLKVLNNARLELPVGGRVAQRVTAAVGGCIFDVVNTHLHHLPENNEQVRLRQVDCILKWIKKGGKSGYPTILLGDFNATPESETIMQVRSSFSSAYARVHGSEPTCTFPTPLVTDSGDRYMPMTIDYIFYQPDFCSIEDAYLICTQPDENDASLYASDHFGMAAIIRFTR